MNVAISQPTQDLRDMLTKSKLNRMIESCDYLKNNITGDLNIKNAFDRMLFLVYTYGNAQVGYTTDANIYDEVSRSNPSTIQMLKSRQLNSKHKIEIFISNPSVPNDLLHNTFLKSDQKHWFVECSCCGKKQLLNWNGMYGFKGNVCYEREQFVCQYCDEVLDYKDIQNGEWLKRFKERDISGFWIWQGMRPTSSQEEQHELVKEMIYEENKSKATFYNMFLGLPYAGSDVKVDSYLIKQNLTKEDPNGLTVLGVDIGSATGHHYVLAKNNHIIKLGRAKNWKEIRKIMKENKVQMCVVDNNPERGAAIELQQEYPNLVWRANYVGNKTEDIINYKEEEGLVNINRNIHFDNIINDLSKGVYKFKFSENDYILNDFCDQFGTMSKIEELDSLGTPIFKWKAPEGQDDHFAHAFLYMTIAQHRLSEIMPKYGVVDSDNDRSFGGTQRDMDFSEKKDKDEWMNL